MVSASATTSASNAFHHTAECSHAAAPVPATTGATALGSVRGRAPEIHCPKLATKTSGQDLPPVPHPQSSLASCTTMGGCSESSAAAASTPSSDPTPATAPATPRTGQAA